MSRQRFDIVGATLGSLAVLAVLVGAPSVHAKKSSAEVWAIDQSDSEADRGGVLWIWPVDELAKKPGAAVPEVIDLATAFDAAMQAGKAGDCIAPRRPHMVFTNSQPPIDTVVIANVASGSTLFMDTSSRAIVGCVQTALAAGDPLNSHVAVPAPDDSMVITTAIGNAGQSGFVYKIRTDLAQDDFELVETLDLATAMIEGVPVLARLGTATARPICHSFSEDGGFAYITLAAGGLIVLDPGSADGTTPMRVAHVYPASVVPGTGCGTRLVRGNRMLSTSESGQFGGDDFLLIFQAPPAGGSDFPDPVVIALPGEDAHGPGICEAGNGDLFAHVAMRVSGEVTIVDLQTHQVVDTIALEAPWAVDVKPDLVEGLGKHLFVTLRGPRPLSAIPALTNAARVPGVGVLKLAGNCRKVRWAKKSLAPMVDADRLVDVDGVQVTASDPHGITIVPLAH